jgi:hypothetical protein
MIRQMINEWTKLKEAGLIREIQKIRTVRLDTEEEEWVEVDNPTDLPLLYRHDKYAVFRLDANRCIRIYPKKGEAEREYANLRLGAERGISLDAYDWGPNYVVVEHLEVPSVLEHLNAYVMTRELAERLIQLFNDLDQAGFMTNHAPEEILIGLDGRLRTLNLKKNLISKPPFPKKMLKGLGSHAKTFLRYARDINKAMYEEWSRLPDFSEYDARSLE